jgi:hypothetical protein
MGINCKKACLYDFCFASLMMDICRSFQRLVVLVMNLLSNSGDSHILKFLLRVMADLSGYSSSKHAIDRILKDAGYTEFRELKESSLTFMNKTDSDIHFTDKTYTLRKDDSEMRFWVIVF